MQENSIIKQNILKYLEYKGISQYKFHQDTGITRGILTQNNGMNESNTLRFLDYYNDVSPEWLLTGKGSMLKGEAQDPGSTTDLLTENRQLKEKIELQKEIIALLKEKLERLQNMAEEDAPKNRKAG